MWGFSMFFVFHGLAGSYLQPKMNAKKTSLLFSGYFNVSLNDTDNDR